MAVLYLTGIGSPFPPVPTGAGAPNSPLSRFQGTAMIQVGGVQATNISFVGLTPQTVGVAQANFQIPAGLAPGDHKVSITLFGQTASGPVISVK